MIWNKTTNIVTSETGHVLSPSTREAYRRIYERTLADIQRCWWCGRDNLQGSITKQSFPVFVDGKRLPKQAVVVSCRCGRVACRIVESTITQYFSTRGMEIS